MRHRWLVAGVVVLVCSMGMSVWAEDGNLPPPPAPRGVASADKAPSREPSDAVQPEAAAEARGALSAIGRIGKSITRELIVDTFGTPERRTQFGLELDADWQKGPLDKGLVVFIHGFQSRPERYSSILKEVRQAGIPCAVLRYPNDQALDQSAALLAKELRKVTAAQGERPVTILALSMGGLIARAVVEDPKLDPGNVKRLLLVATPNHGSEMAKFAIGTDLFEFLVRAPEGSWTKRLYAAVEDGLGEAATDLRPGSDFLRELNARKRNPKVSYSLFLGTAGLIDEEMRQRLRERMSERGRRGRLARFAAGKGDHMLAEMDEIVKGKGDGVVAVERSRLKGVEDTVVLGFGHCELMDAPTEASRELRKELLKRLKP
jgi:pimeloyl-ACP methyl ester carboxylesterase